LISTRGSALLLGVFLPSIASLPAGAQNRFKATFRFSQEAGVALQAMWRESVAAREERVACLAATIRSDTVFVTRVSALEPEDADSTGISATESVEQCGPPTWSGTVHTHIAMYSDSLPSTHFSAQDRTAMRLWYDRWHADGVFCLIYSSRDAHCEADGVVGGMRSQPKVVGE
jgi:hypothetical protein